MMLTQNDEGRYTHKRTWVIEDSKLVMRFTHFSSGSVEAIDDIPE